MEDRNIWTIQHMASIQENRMATVNTRQLMSAAAAVMNEVRKRRSNAAAAPVIQMKNEVLVS